MSLKKSLLKSEQQTKVVTNAGLSYFAQQFNKVVDILNEYRSNGNDGRGKYYQFQRLGNNDPSTVDFDKARRIHRILQHKQEYQRDAIISNRYNVNAVVRNQRRIDSVHIRMQEAMDAWRMKYGRYYRD